MKIIEYKSQTELYNDLKYWCNALGELHHHGEYDIEESELPTELKRAYEELWTDGNGSLCYLVEYKDNYSIALVNEFDDTYVLFCTLDDAPRVRLNDGVSARIKRSYANYLRLFVQFN